MFGYVVVNRPELKIREYEEYQGYYCGLCRTLKKNYGFAGQMVLSFDMTFLLILLTGLYEPEEIKLREHCKEGIIKRKLKTVNRFSDYAADMNVLLTYYKLLDDWEDEGKYSRLAASKIIKKQAVKARLKHPLKAAFIRNRLRKLKAYEKNGEKNIDVTAGCFGEITREIFLWRKDEWEKELGKMGFFLGKYLYITDAADDLEEDKKKGEYNPLLKKYKKQADREDFEAIREEAKKIRIMMMAECAKSFERLPVIKNAEIIRNILYAGVWNVRKGKTKRSTSGRRAKDGSIQNSGCGKDCHR